MKRFLKWLFADALNITVTTRRYTVSSGGWSGGHFECFWFRRNAIKYSKTQYGEFVDIRDELTGKTERVRWQEWENGGYVQKAV